MFSLHLNGIFVLTMFGK